MLHALRGAVGGWCGRGLVGHVLGLLLYQRISAVCGRMERIVARFEAGRLWRLPPRVGAGTAGGSGGVCRMARVWPYGFGWLVKLASWQAAGYGSQLRAVLATPEMVALLVACPQAGRVLLPVCRMLSVESSVLRPQVAGGTKAVGCSPVGAVTIVDVARVRVRAPRLAVDWGRIALPRGVLSAARRQGFGKLPKDAE